MSPNFSSYNARLDLSPNTCSAPRQEKQHKQKGEAVKLNAAFGKEKQGYGNGQQKFTNTSRFIPMPEHISSFGFSSDRARTTLGTWMSDASRREKLPTRPNIAPCTHEGNSSAIWLPLRKSGLKGHEPDHYSLDQFSGEFNGEGRTVNLTDDATMDDCC